MYCARLGCLGALADLPALDLVIARCEEVYELDRTKARRDDLGQRRDRLILPTTNVHISSMGQ